MKKIIYLLLILVSCKEEKVNYIEGSLANLDATQIIIKSVDYKEIGASALINDTLNIINGKFKFKYTSDYPILLSFELLKNKKTIGTLAFYEKSSKNLNGNLCAYQENIKIIHDTDDFEKINGLKYPIFKANFYDSETTNLYHSLKHIKLDNKFIKENNKSIVVLWELYWQNDKFNSQELNSMLNSFDSSLRKNYTYLRLKEILAKKIKLENIGYSKNFSWNDINGEKYNFKSASSTKPYVLLVFWASWCAPCREEIPELKELFFNYNDRLSIVGLSIDDNYNSWQKAVIKEKMPWLNLSGLPDDKTGVKNKYNITAVPELILTNDKGEVLLKNIKGLDQIKSYLDTHE